MSVDFEDTRVLVTGGAGFLGSAVRRVLAKRGATDVVVPRSRDHDLTDRTATARLFDEARPGLVIHLAARVGGIGANMEHPAEIYLANLLMGTYVIEEARRTGVAKTVLVGTICSYPKFTPVPFSEASLWDGYPEETNAPYGIAKKALLVHAHANRDQYGQNCIYLLPANLYGPGDKFNESVSHVIPALVKRFVDAKRSSAGHVTVWGTGSATREFLYVDDAARGIVDAAQHYDSAEPVNLGTSEEISIKDLAELIAKLVGFQGELEWDTSRPDGQPRRRVDASRARDLFGFEARVPLEEGLRHTIAYYEANPDEAEAATF
ncbi:MAG: GDP-L-fucose synthase family protein [Actinomycetota bacterium]